MSEEFSWDGEDTVFRTRQGVAVYTNTQLDIVVRQQQDHLVDETDKVIVIPKEHAKAVAEAILRELELHEQE